MKLSDFLQGKFKYDADGQLIFLVKPNGYLQRIIDLRGWGAIQNLFRNKDQSIDIDAAAKFQDELGEWIAATLNEKLALEGPKPEKIDFPIVVGYLKKEYGYEHYLPAKIGTEVYEDKDRYFFWITPVDPKVDFKKQTFYKEDLKEHINFLQPVKENKVSSDNFSECKECGKQNSESCNTCDVINPQYH